jgi:hypothetical protein
MDVLYVRRIHGHVVNLKNADPVTSGRVISFNIPVVYQPTTALALPRRLLTFWAVSSGRL